jgi:hypothetical protein
MKCPNCGGELRPGQGICGNCGLPVEARGPSEGREEVIEKEEAEELVEPGQARGEEELVEPERTEATEELYEPGKPAAPEGEEFEGSDGILPKGESGILEETEGRPLGANERAIKEMVSVPPAEYYVVELGDLVTGVRIVGHLKEADGDIFDYFVVDKEGYKGLVQGEEPETLDEADNATSYEIDVEIGEPGYYYLMIKNRSVGDPKDVQVDLRITFP